MSHRPTVYGTRHAVSAGHYLAAAAAFSILEAGGNAIDAGCAAGIALGVLQPDLVNVAGVAPIMIRLAERPRGEHCRSRLVAEIPARRHLHARTRRDDPRRRAAHRHPRRARRLDHRAAAPRHDALCRRGILCNPLRRRGLRGLSAACHLDRLARARVPPLAVQHRDLPAERPRAEVRRQVRAIRPVTHAAIHGGPGSRRRTGSHGGAAGRARCVLPRRHRPRDRRVPETRGRLPVDAGPRRIPFAHRAGGAARLARPRADHLRPVVPGSRAAGGAGTGGALSASPAWRTTRPTICTASPSA